MAPQPDTLDLALELFGKQMIETLTDNAVDAVIAGQVVATHQMGVALNMHLVSSRAVELSRTYRTSLERFGGSEVTKMINGRPTRVFEPWLKDGIAADKERIGQIIADGVERGTPLKELEKQLDEVFAMREHNAKLTAYQETKALYNAGTIDRYKEENVQRGEWVHMDPQNDPREDHQDLDGKVFDIDDPIWDELNLPNCHCRMRPVLVGAAGRVTEEG